MAEQWHPNVVDYITWKLSIANEYRTRYNVAEFLEPGGRDCRVGQLLELTETEKLFSTERIRRPQIVFENLMKVNDWISCG
jgi:hypothetical protein